MLERRLATELSAHFGDTASVEAEVFDFPTQYPRKKRICIRGKRGRFLEMQRMQKSGRCMSKLQWLWCRIDKMRRWREPVGSNLGLVAACATIRICQYGVNSDRFAAESVLSNPLPPQQPIIPSVISSHLHPYNCN